MDNEIVKIDRAVEKIETGIADLREKNAGREVWEGNTEKRIDHLYDKKMPNFEGRLEKVEAFQIKLGVGLAILPFIIPLLLNYIFKLVTGG